MSIARILWLMAVTVASVSIPGVAASAPFTMACKAQVSPGLVDPTHGRVASLPVLVNPEQGTVNQLPAAITDALIIWTDNSDPKSEPISFILDRTTMVFSVNDAAGVRLMLGSCVAAQTPQTVVPPTDTPKVPPFMLVCRMTTAIPQTYGVRPQTDWNLMVDSANSTVNGWPATLTADRIIIHQSSTEKHLLREIPHETVVEVNRITGSASVRGDDNILLLTGNCEVASAPKF